VGVHDHHRNAPRSVSCAVVTVSDTRTPDTDESGTLTRSLLERSGHRIAASLIVPDEPERVHEEILSLLLRDDVEAVLVNGGTGISPRDRTYEAIESLLERTLPGFGELFRNLSYQQIGPAAMMSRAVAGLSRGRLVFSMPGAAQAVRLAMESLILPEIGHMAGEARKGMIDPPADRRP
jgi:molybdopterin adenylyltransferase